MTSAEDWLAENDPEYEESRESWKQIRASDEYHAPAQEVAWGDADDHLSAGAGQIGGVGERTCERVGCDTLFAPTVSRHRFCSELCQQRARKRDRKLYMRAYRRIGRRRAA